MGSRFWSRRRAATSSLPAGGLYRRIKRERGSWDGRAGDTCSPHDKPADSPIGNSSNVSTCAVASKSVGPIVPAGLPVIVARGASPPSPSS
jgi:hypothetical protein